MTIQVTITNKDPACGVSVKVEDIDKESGRRTRALTKRIGPGETDHFWIHQLRDLRVEQELPSTPT